MILQGVCQSHRPGVRRLLLNVPYSAPMFWGSLADRIGRRLILLACLLVLSTACIGLALAPTSDYWLLMLLRCIQATGSASTVALGMFQVCSTQLSCRRPEIGAGVIGDIGTRAERGTFFALFALGPQVCHFIKARTSDDYRVTSLGPLSDLSLEALLLRL